MEIMNTAIRFTLPGYATYIRPYRTFGYVLLSLYTDFNKFLFSSTPLIIIILRHLDYAYAMH
jgi:hypothetical protein